MLFRIQYSCYQETQPENIHCPTHIPTHFQPSQSDNVFMHLIKGSFTKASFVTKGIILQYAFRDI